MSWRLVDELHAATEAERRAAEPTESAELLSLEATAARLGVPPVQLARWCADGSIAPRAFVGSPLGLLQFRPAAVAALLAAIQGGAVNAPEP